HTRCYRDWSSDVCSSDLWGIVTARVASPPQEARGWDDSLLIFIASSTLRARVRGGGPLGGETSAPRDGQIRRSRAPREALVYRRPGRVERPYRRVLARPPN